MGSPLPQIHDTELQSLSLQHMTRMRRVSVQIALRVRMEDARLMTIQHVWQTRRVRQPEDAPIRVVLRRAHDRDGLREHDLVPRARVQVAAGQEARLRRVRVDPAADEELVAVAVVEKGVVAGFGGVACVGCGGLVGDDEVVDEERVGDDGPAEDAAGLEVALGVLVGDVEEGGA